MPQAAKELYVPRSNATISTASPAIRLACEAALIPAASAPMTTIRSVIGSEVVRISVPARTALVTGVFSAISASMALWSSSTPCRVTCRSIHLVFLSLTT